MWKNFQSLCSRLGLKPFSLVTIASAYRVQAKKWTPVFKNFPSFKPFLQQFLSFWQSLCTPTWHKTTYFSLVKNCLENWSKMRSTSQGGSTFFSSHPYVWWILPCLVYITGLLCLSKQCGTEMESLHAKNKEV